MSPWLIAGASLLLATFVGVAFGSSRIPLSEFITLVFGAATDTGNDSAASAMQRILVEVRLPRVLLMMLIGAALGSSGAAYQGLFRNPLADPYLIGVASGAGLGATTMLALVPTASGENLSLIPLGAFLGGMGAVGVVILISHVGKTMPIATMLLAGVAVGSFCAALTTFWMMRSPAGLQRSMTWLLGGNSGESWQSAKLIIPYLLVGMVGVQTTARFLNVLQLDEDQARQLGVHVDRVKIIVIASATMMTAAAVSFGGLIGFVGLVVPHVLRILAGPDYRRLIPLSALGGATFLILADTMARTVFAPQVLPVGIVTAMIGAPFFVALLRQQKRSVF